ncbi:hypothetical protein TNCT_399211 [Trichonephila clavata]|uniref:Uncharacterized protein n=1 Tax=Trichonephila clavata TaxID=2740835 RepID=A0A8X6HHX2_TRICU|nr:hypothetical protein TNCT_399211 [Trichonephila clavata]
MELSAASEAPFGQELEEPRFQRPLDSNLPRAVSVAAFRMKTGHDYLAAHLHCSNVQPSAECQVCGYGIMNAEHLMTCSALDHSKNCQNNILKEAHLYWSARHLMAQHPKGERWLRRRSGSKIE